MIECENEGMLVSLSFRVDWIECINDRLIKIDKKIDKSEKIIQHKQRISFAHYSIIAL